MCKFPSKELLRVLRKLAQQADEIKDDEFCKHLFAFSNCLRELRWAHEELTGCQCWYETCAAEAENAPVAPCDRGRLARMAPQQTWYEREN